MRGLPLCIKRREESHDLATLDPIARHENRHPISSCKHEDLVGLSVCISYGVQFWWVVKNDRRRKRMTSMLRILFLELEGDSAMSGIRSV